MSAASVRDWIETKNKKAALKLEKLDTDLKNYKSNSIKVIFHSYQQKLRFKFAIKAKN
jgi:hypothetical protein